MKEGEPLCWSAQFALVTSRFFLGDVVRFLSLTYLVLVVVSFLMNVAAGNRLSDFFPMLALWGLAVGGLGVFVLLVDALILFAND